MKQSERVLTHAPRQLQFRFWPLSIK